ncbi:MAG TPA: ABC transporter permease [Anaerolineales bacterium]|nr:ABC transporter permease [Anaerolineales bacterium]
MPPLLRFVIRRFVYACVSLIVITMVLYAGVMLTPPAARAQLYVPPGKDGTHPSTESFIQKIVKEYHLDDPYPMQYGYWVKSLLQGNWGYSPTLREDVLTALLRRTSITLELALYSLLVLIPLGIISGLLAGWKPRQPFDNTFRSLAFFGTTMPPFIFSFVLLSLFYVNLGWFAPGRLDYSISQIIDSDAFRSYTGMVTLDGLLNGRLDVFWDAARHLVMPVLTLAMYHWATLGRITRATIMAERGKEYLIAAKARGIPERKLMWRHALRSVLAPSLTSVALSAASILTGVFVVEIIFGLKGISSVLVSSVSSAPDAPAALGFAVYSVILVVSLMFLLDVAQALADPRVRDEVLKT